MLIAVCDQQCTKFHWFVHILRVLTSHYKSQLYHFCRDAPQNI